MKDWEKYEDQIFSKLREQFPEAEIIKDHKIRGVYSGSLRQIDVFVDAEVIGRKLRVVIDCKKFSKNIDVKVVESFIGFLEDVKANMGIMITTVGYTKGAKSRVENYGRDIRLELQDFEEFENFEFEWFDCLACRISNPDKPSPVFWRDMSVLELDDFNQLIEYGECNRCGTLHIKCNDCGEYMDLNEDIYNECGCGLSYRIRWTAPKNNPDEFEILVKDSDGNELSKPFVDPDQTNLFDR